MFGYHVTYEDNLESILREGLKPAIGERSRIRNESDPAVYLFPSRSYVEDALTGWLGEYLESREIVILEVRLDDDFMTEQGFEIISEIDIPPSYINAVYNESWNRVD